MGQVGAVLFDLDDTLLDADAAWRSGVGRLIARAPHLGLAEATQAWGEVFAPWFERFLEGEISLAASRTGRVRDWASLVGVDVPPGSELAWFDTFAEGYRDGWVLFPDVAGALARLGGIPLGIVTNGDGQQQREKVRALGLDAHVGVVVVSTDVGPPKPHPRVFEVAAAGLGVAAAECAVVGDLLDRDVRGALAAGMRAVWLRRPDGPEAATIPAADLVGRFTTIASLDDLSGVLGITADVAAPAPSGRGAGPARPGRS
jgi:putative hydrolase of the HAD superfamily